MIARALTVAGSDSGGGAGIQADLKTFQELGVFGTTAITAITVQNSRGVHGIVPLSPAVIAEQIAAVLGDIGADAVKTGMLHSAAVMETVALELQRFGCRRVVVDPVIVAKDESRLMEKDALQAAREVLMPLAYVVTPNLPEAAALLGIEETAIRSRSDMEEAAGEILKLGPQFVLLKGGHAGHLDDPSFAADVLVGRSGAPLWLVSERIDTQHTHGTGCTLSAAIAACLALGYPVEEAARHAKRFVSAAIAEAIPLGSGIGSLRHAAHRSR